MKLAELLEKEEGLRLKPYRDTEGFWTIGIGHKILPGERFTSITREQAFTLFEKDIQKMRSELHLKAPWVYLQNETRIMVLEAMAYQMGVQGLLKFTGTIAAIRTGQYDRAKKRMLASAWADQTPARAARMANLMETG